MRAKSVFKFISFLILFSFQIAYADNESSFPFDNECLKFNKTTFKAGGSLLDLLKTGDFPQYCFIYSLSKFQIKQKRDDGYFINSTNMDEQPAQTTTVFIKTKKLYHHNQTIDQSVYFTGQERFMMDKGQEKEFYTFQEIDQ